MASPKDFKVIVIGGGICGAALTAGLSRAGVDVRLFEAAAQFEEVGAGIGLGINALRVMDDLGILDIVTERSGDARQKTFRFFSEAGDHKLIYDNPENAAGDGLGIHRAALLDAIATLVDPSIVSFNKRCVRITPSPTCHKSLIHFADGTVEEGDVVIGADGIKSSVRDAVVPDATRKHLVYTNTTAARALISTQTLKEAGFKTELSDRLVCFVGPNRHIIAFPINLGKTINIVAWNCDPSIPIGSVTITPPWVRPVAMKDLIDRFDGCGEDVKRILQCMDDPKEWFVHALSPPLPTFTRGTVILIGDAAHGMLPHLGAGAGQGIEDVYMLIKLLSHPETSLSNLVEVAQAYDDIRVPRANTVLKQSEAAGKLYDSLGTLTEEEFTSKIKGQWDFVWNHDIQEDVASALDLLRSKGTFKSS